jgi:hypothetical protein
MKHLKEFEEYNEGNRSLNKFGKFVAGAAIAGSTLYGINTLIPETPKKTTSTYQETDKAHFPEFYVKTIGWFSSNINVSVNEVDGVIGSKTKHGKRSDYTITVEEGIDKIYWRRSSWGEYIYATTDPSNLPGSDLLDLSKLEVIDENNEYKILKVPDFWSNLDYILVNKGYENKENEFEMNGQKYTYLEKNLGFWEGTHSFVIKAK